ncbi:MAG: MarR family transcriptional regulator [Hoeflea sp.]|uniref:MarR family winged helix-turn-helix transcriptional regulator n=1 Tax=Hoeflea sp. TaxID=1940281 RepID=UPI003297DBAA|tara:strand:- start:17280 stop:17735 length:456 start_codon:yes stop_codon:yes gene_type:complete
MTDEHEYQLRGGLGFRFTRTARLMERHYERLLGELGLSRIMWCVLVMRGLYGIQSPSAMADYLGVDRAVISRILGSMDRKGMISRIPLDGDKRGRDVHLTALGKQKLDAFLPRAMETANYFRSKLTEAEFQQLNLILDKMMQGEDGALPGL